MDVEATVEEGSEGAAAPAASKAVRVDVVWEGDQRYRGGRPGGPTLLVDADRELAPGPVDTLMIALASCSAVDVVGILEKRRTPPTSLRVQVDFERATTAPRRVLSAHLRWVVATASDRPNLERALDLAMGKYCSVVASLAPDLKLSWELEIDGPAGGDA